MGDLTEGSRVGKQGVVVFVILYYSSFVFYFDVVCEIVLFQSHLKPLAGGIEERRRQSSRMDVNLTSLVPEVTLHFCNTLDTATTKHSHAYAQSEVAILAEAEVHLQKLYSLLLALSKFSGLHIETI